MLLHHSVLVSTYILHGGLVCVCIVIWLHHTTQSHTSIFELVWHEFLLVRVCNLVQLFTDTCIDVHACLGGLIDVF